MSPALLLFSTQSTGEMRTRPRIGITMKVIPRQGGRSPQQALPTPYVEAVWQAGGLPVLIPNVPEAVSTYAEELHGLLLSGGGDVHPARYTSEPKHPAVYGIVPERDETEIGLVHFAIQRDVPLLAICRGIQVLNVALGGTLLQDIEACVPGALPHSTPDDAPARQHSVSLEPRSRVASVLGTTNLIVNTFHHQAVARPGEGVRVVGRAPDGVVEAVEVEKCTFVIGVQWHPELLSTPHDRLFVALVGAAGDFLQNKGV